MFILIEQLLEILTELSDKDLTINWLIVCFALIWDVSIIYLECLDRGCMKNAVISYSIRWQGGKGHGLFITLVPNVFLFVDLTTLGTFVELWLVGSRLRVYKLFNQ